jgi:hypothetical protein
MASNDDIYSNSAPRPTTTPLATKAGHAAQPHFIVIVAAVRERRRREKESALTLIIIVVIHHCSSKQEIEREREGWLLAPMQQ